MNKKEEINMMYNRSLDLSSEWEEVYLGDPEFVPDKTLLFAILERALLDLFIDEEDKPNLTHKRKAITWILSPKKKVTDGFSFLEIVDYLSLNEPTTIKIIELAHSIDQGEGEYYELYLRYRSGCYRCLRNLI